MTAEDLARLAEQLQAPVRPEHLEETLRAWRLMEPHRRTVRETALGTDAEPAPVFRP
jgi:hypothetical protein